LEKSTANELKQKKSSKAFIVMKLNAFLFEHIHEEKVYIFRFEKNAHQTDSKCGEKKYYKACM
jgi:hypothetical protein